MCTQMRTHGLACHWLQFPQSEILRPKWFGRQKVHPPRPLARQEHSLSRDDVYHLSTRCGQHSLSPMCVIGVRSCVARIFRRRHISRRVSTQGYQQVLRTPEEHSCNSVCTVLLPHLNSTCLRSTMSAWLATPIVPTSSGEQICEFV